jgi:ABC-type phosphate transport system substrate-binding protein
MPQTWRLLLGLLGAVLAGPTPADDAIAVIVGKNPPHIAFDRANLEDIFLRHIQVDDERAALVPLNLSSTEPLRIAFSLSLLGERPEALQRYWTERYFHGISPPYTVHSEESMLRFVAETPGAIGYVAACRADGRVRVVARLPVPAELAGQIHQLCDKAGGTE